MRNAKVILLGGPFDDQFVGIVDREGLWPDEIRVASGHEKNDEDKIDAATYVLDSMEKWGESYILWFGSYVFRGMKSTAPTLITVWKE